eukprot:TRINITY_DN9216_c0_g1_i1.p2 TRINITY_DN9216_c0_g1~~TRINITY_DN9216_c0_g1_i1.p2  ORF type:complete len:108 (+),score=9.56 TRINITY_DN9216_c0_g1_i1:410-733(+)
MACSTNPITKKLQSYRFSFKGTFSTFRLVQPLGLSQLLYAAKESFNQIMGVAHLRPQTAGLLWMNSSSFLKVGCVRGTSSSSSPSSLRGREIRNIVTVVCHIILHPS